MENKCCPFMLAIPNLDDTQYFCLTKKCAWWSKSTEDCAILMIGNYIATAWLLLDEALGKKEKGARQAKKKGAKS